MPVVFQQILAHLQLPIRETILAAPYKSYASIPIAYMLSEPNYRVYGYMRRLSRPTHHAAARTPLKFERSDQKKIHYSKVTYAPPFFLQDRKSTRLNSRH